MNCDKCGNIHDHAPHEPVDWSDDSQVMELVIDAIGRGHTHVLAPVEWVRDKLLPKQPPMTTYTTGGTHS